MSAEPESAAIVPAARKPRLRRLVPWLALLTLAAELIYVFGLPLVERLRPIPDDSFFYLQVALRFQETGLFSFDGVVETYGFHPLPQLVAIALAELFATPQQLFAAALTLTCILHVATGWQLFRLGARAFGPAAGATAAVLWTWNPAVMVWCWGLKENSIYALLLVTAALQLLRMDRQGTTLTRAALLGAVFGAITLCRLNAGLCVGILALAFVIAGWPARELRRRLTAMLLAGAVAALVCAPWYGFAWLHFGTVMPTSGEWKMLLMTGHVRHHWQSEWFGAGHFLGALGDWPGYLWFLFRHGYGLLRPALLALLLVGGAAAVVRLARGSGPPRRGGLWIGAALAVCALGNSFVNQLMLPMWIGYGDWYAVPEFVVVPLLAGAAAGVLTGAPPRRRPGRLALAFAFGLATAAIWWFYPPGLGLLQRHERGLLAEPPRQMQLLEMGLWARRTLPDDAAIGLWDPGIVAYFSGKRLVSFDPLMNSPDYLRHGVLDPVAYVKAREIAYMFGVVRQEGDRWTFDPLPAGTYEIVWLPFPDHDIGFEQVRKLHYAVVRPLASPVPEFLTLEQLPCGELYPNDPARRRRITTDRDRLVRGDAVAADSLRLWLDVPAGGGDLELRAAGSLIRRFAAGTRGYRAIDVTAWRGRELTVALAGADPASAIRQAHVVDFAW